MEKGKSVWGLQAGARSGVHKMEAALASHRQMEPGAPGFWKNSLLLSTATFIPNGMVVDFKSWVYFFFYPEESDSSTLREILIVNY